MLDALTTIGGAGIYSTSQVKDYMVMPETNTSRPTDLY